MKKVYTEKIHAKRLLAILSKKNPCGFCPPSRKHSAVDYAGDMWNDDEKVCVVCVGFVGLDCLTLNYFDFLDGKRNCPCHRLDHQEAIKRTWLALEEKGYI